MANKRIKSNELVVEVEAICKQYEKDLAEQIEKDLKECSRIAMSEVKKPPAGAEHYHSWDDYSSGWHYSTDKRFGTYSIEIKNTKKPGLTHLLEKGHVNPDGVTRAKAFPHIERAKNIAEEELIRRLES